MMQVTKEKPRGPENIYEVLSPIYYLFKVIGIYSFSFDGPIKKGKIQYSFFDKLYGLVFLLWNSLLIYELYNSVVEPFYSSTSSSLIAFGWTAQIISQAIFNVSQHIFNAYNYNDTVGFLKVIAEFDKNVR